MLVVLSIVAMAAGMATPSISRWVEKSQANVWRKDLATALVTLPLRAHAGGVPLRLDAAALRASVPGLPPGVEIRMTQPLQYWPNGSAGGGSFTLHEANRSPETWVIEPLSGRLKVQQ
jgi:type II secretory pathway pseudopilin PulG